MRKSNNRTSISRISIAEKLCPKCKIIFMEATEGGIKYVADTPHSELKNVYADLRKKYFYLTKKKKQNSEDVIRILSSESGYGIWHIKRIIGIYAFSKKLKK